MRKGYLPDLSYIKKTDYLDVYEPAEDTFLLIDTLIDDFDNIKTRNPSLILEVGSGNGSISKTVAELFLTTNQRPLFFAIDISKPAINITKKAFESINDKNVVFDLVQSDLFFNFRKGFLFDICIFNPPYVVTSSDEVDMSSIARTWAGGLEGREVIDRFIDTVGNVMSEDGVLYLLCIKENKPSDICNRLLLKGFKSANVVSTKIAFNESLKIIKACKKK